MFFYIWRKQQLQFKEKKITENEYNVNHKNTTSLLILLRFNISRNRIFMQ